MREKDRGTEESDSEKRGLWTAEGEGVAGKEGRLVRRGRAVERTGRVRSGGGGGSGAEQ